MEMDQPQLTPRQHKCFVVWLGISESECPPDHYRLLGIPMFERDSNVIRAALQQRRSLVSRMAKSEDKRELRAINKVFASVEAILLNPVKKYDYDEKVRQFHATQNTKSIEIESAQEKEPSVPPDAGKSGSLSQNDTTTRPDVRRDAVEAATYENNIPVASDSSLEFQSKDGCQEDVESAPAHAARPLPNDRVEEPQNESNRFQLNTAVLVAGLLVSNVFLMAMVMYLLLTRPNAASLATQPTPIIIAQSDSVSALSPPASKTMQDADYTTAENFQNDSDVPIRKEASPVEVTTVLSDEQVSRVEDAPTAKPEEETNAKPFEMLATEFDLPEIPSVAMEVSDSATPGEIAAGAIDGLQLELDSSAANLGGVYEFQVRTAEEDTDHRRWNVFAVPAENQPGTDTRLGYFMIRENNQLRFYWSLSTPFPNAGQLKNSLLILESNEQVHVVQLRRAQHHDRFSTSLAHKADPVLLGVDHLPSLSTLALQVHPLRGFDHQGNAEPNLRSKSPDYSRARQKNVAPISQARVSAFTRVNNVLAQVAGEANGKVDFPKYEVYGDGDRARTPLEASAVASIPVGGIHELPVDQEGRVRLDVKFDLPKEKAKPHSVEISARMRKGGFKGKSRYVSVDLEGIKDDLIRQQHAINSAVLDYSEATQICVNCQASLQPLFQRFNELRNRPATDRSANMERASLNTKMAPLQLSLKKYSSIQSGKMAAIPKMYFALLESVRSARVANKLHNKGEVEFHLVSKTKSGWLKLFSADGLPAVDRKEVDLLPLKLPGQWFRFDTGYRYSLGGTNDGGDVTITPAFNPKLPTYSGSWTRTKDNIQIRAVGVSENYTLREDVMMSNSVTSLFRSLR